MCLIKAMITVTRRRDSLIEQLLTACHWEIVWLRDLTRLIIILHRNVAFDSAIIYIVLQDRITRSL